MTNSSILALSIIRSIIPTTCTTISYFEEVPYSPFWQDHNKREQGFSEVFSWLPWFPLEQDRNKREQGFSEVFSWAMKIFCLILGNFKLWENRSWRLRARSKGGIRREFYSGRHLEAAITASHRALKPDFQSRSNLDIANSPSKRNQPAFTSKQSSLPAVAIKLGAKFHRLIAANCDGRIVTFQEIGSC